MTVRHTGAAAREAPPTIGLSLIAGSTTVPSHKNRRLLLAGSRLPRASRRPPSTPLVRRPRFGRRLGFEPKFLSANLPTIVPQDRHADRARDVEQLVVLFGLLLAPDVEAPPRARLQRGFREPRQHCVLVILGAESALRQRVASTAWLPPELARQDDLNPTLTDVQSTAAVAGRACAA